MNKKHYEIVRTLLNSKLMLVVVLVIALTLSFSSLAQSTSNKDSLTKSASNIKKKEHEVPNGSKVQKLPKGMPIAAFNTDGEKKKALEDFITEQKVAGLIVVQDGKIRLERYSLGHSKSALWSSLSVAKSITSTLVGAAIKDGYIKSINDYVTDYIPDLKGSAYDSVTIRHLITMTTGVRWSENYTDPNGDIAKFETDSIEPGMNATVSYMRRLPYEAEPGKKWVYSTGETHLLGVVVSAATHQTLSHYLSSKIWVPYGMEQTATWRLDRTGQEMAGCCLQMPLRDFARFGQFVLEGGRINGKSIVPDGWFETATSIQVPLWPGGGYGYGWWIFGGDNFEALGIHGQMIHVDPARHLVVAINGAWPEADSNERHAATASFINIIAMEIDKEKKDRLANNYLHFHGTY